MAFAYRRLAVVSLLVASASLPALAQDGPPAPPLLPGDLVIGDLFTPRGIAFDTEGNLIVTVTGNGGETEVMSPVPGSEELQPVRIGASGRILSIDADGEVTTLIDALPSYAAPGEITGAYRAIPHEGSLWLLTSAVGANTPYTDTIIEIDRETGYPVQTIGGLWAYEMANNPDGNEIDSNVADIAWLDDGTMLIADAGANALLTWTAEDGFATYTAWPDNAVPTSVEIADNGDVYVGFLGAGIAPGAGRVERWADGELAETFGGLTGVTDILLDGEDLYATQLFLFGAEGPGPGSVVMVTADGMEPVAEGLITPFGLAQDEDGALYVSFGTLAFAPGMTGGVVRIAGE